MTLRCSKQRFFPLKTLSTEEEDSAILHVSSPVTPVTCGKQRNSQWNRPMGRLELNTESVWGPTWYQRGQKHPSTCPEGDEHPSSSAAPWLELTTYLHISCEIRNVWILFEKPWFRCVFCFIVFHVDILGISMLFQTRYVSSFKPHTPFLPGAENAFGAKFRLAALCAKAAARLGSRFSDFSVVNFFVHFFVKRSTQGLLCSAMIWSYKMCATTRWKYSAWAPESVEWSHGVGAKSSPAKKMDIVRIVHIILHIVTFLQMWNRKILGIFLICLLRKVHKIAAESVAWFQANLPAMQNGDCQPTHWVGEENYRWTYRIHVSISPCQTFTDILSEVGPHQPCFHEIEHSESFKPFGFFWFFSMCVSGFYRFSTYWIFSPAGWMTSSPCPTCCIFRRIPMWHATVMASLRCWALRGEPHLMHQMHHRISSDKMWQVIRVIFEI